MHIRRWIWDDFPEICALFRDVSKGYGKGDLAHYPPANPVDMYGHWLRLFSDCAGWVATRDDKIIGVLALEQTAPEWNSKAITLVSACFWVDQNQKSGGVAARLLDEGQALAKEMGLPLKIDVTMGRDDPDLVDRFMRTKKFKHTGGVHFLLPSKEVA